MLTGRYLCLQLAIFSACYGFFISTNYALAPIVVVQILGVRQLANAYGMSLVGEGLANILGPPLAGNSCSSFPNLKISCRDTDKEQLSCAKTEYSAQMFEAERMFLIQCVCVV